MGANSEIFLAIARKRASRSDRDATETDNFAETILRGRLKCTCAGDCNSSVTLHPRHAAGGFPPFVQSHQYGCAIFETQAQAIGGRSKRH